jgi:hypothetical protein
MAKVGEGQFVPGDVLHLDFEEPDRLSYLTSPANVSAVRADDLTHYTLTFEHTPLDSEQLFRFIETVAPYKRFNSIGGTLADWDIVDNVRGGGEAQRLVTIHEKMGTPWLEFLKSRGAFSDTLRDGMQPHFGQVTALPNEVGAPKQSERQHAKTEMLDERATSYDDAVQLLKDAGVEDAEQKFYDAMRTVINSRRKKTNLSNPNRIKQESRKKDIARWLGRLLPEDTLEALVSEKEKELYGRVTDEEGVTYSFPRARYPYTDEEFATAIGQTQTVRRGAYEADVTVLKRMPLYPRTPNPEPEDYVIVRPDRIRRVIDSIKIEPIVTWTKDEAGKRELTLERGVDVAKGFCYTDGVLGALAVAYHSPELTRTWPAAMRLGTGREQQLGVAQVPVLALFPKYRNELVNSPFIKAAEDAIRAA